MTATCGSMAAPAKCRSAAGGRSAGSARPVPDERAALEAEIARLQTENAALKKELLARNLPLPGAVKPEPPAPKAEEPRLQLPSDAELNQVMGFIEKVWRRLVEMIVNAAEGHDEKDMTAGAATRPPCRRLSAISSGARTARDSDAGGRDRRAGIYRDHARGRALLAEAGAQRRALLLFLRHTSASLVIQENADPDVRTDLATALERLAPADAGWVHDTEGPDDMPAHVKTMLTGVSLQCR